jgi:cobaltochelatase CobN
MLNQMVVDLISVPGVLSPEMVAKFKHAVEKAAAKSLDQQTAERQRLLAKLDATATKAAPDTAGKDSKNNTDPDRTLEKDKTEPVEGYKMEKVDPSDGNTSLNTPAIQWAVSVLMLLLLGLFFWGLRRAQRKKM